MKQTQAKKPAAPRKKKDKAVKVLAESAPITEGEMLTEVPPIEEAKPEDESELLTEVPPQEAVEDELLVEATNETPPPALVELVALPAPEIFAAPTPPRQPVGLPRKKKEVSAEALQYTPQQIKKMRGEFSLRTLLTRFGIKL